MPELPALPLGAPVVGPRRTGRATRPRIEGPGPAAQQQRLGGALQRLTAAFNQQRVQVAGDPDKLEPDRVLVLEIAGEVDEFVRAVQRVPGLEYLAEEVEDKVEPDDFAAVDRQGRRHRYARQLFLIASDSTAWQQLLGLWQRFQQGRDFPRGYAPFRHLFERLRELRPWDDRDRLERTGALEAWDRELADLDDEPVEFEIELWLRSSQQRRAAVIADLRADLRDAGGEFLSEVIHDQIDYHGVLGRVPARRLRDAVARQEVRWLRTGGVRFFHAVGQLAAPAAADDVEPEPADGGAGPPAVGDAQIALLDGLPLEGHTLLRDRLVIDDADGWAGTIPALRRVHGTGMASVVVHGDLNATIGPLRAPVYVRPILSPNAPDWVRDAREELPRDRLAVDVVNTAVARLFEGDAVAPGVRVIVLAVGDAVLQFDRFTSPLARLLDWLAFRHSVVFVVSAGNHPEALDIPADTASDDPVELQHELLCAIGRSAALRRLLAPAESVNAVTVGAAHADGSTTMPGDDRLDPLLSGDLPNLSSAVGGGVRRAVKPDLLLPGGRQLVRLEPPSDGRRLATIPSSRRPPGVRMAAPGRQAGVLDATVHNAGTSVAAATAGHYAGHLIESLRTLRSIHGDAMPPPDLDAVLLKAALIHTARWGTARPALDLVSQEIGLRRSRDAVARMVGYGRAAPGDALVCDDHLATVITAGRIGADEARAYRFPLPPSLAARTDRRRVTLTLAWLTPINPRHRNYRRAALKLEPAGPTDVLGDRSDADLYGARRGTVQHEVLVGERAVPYAPGSAIELVVSCRADAGALEAQVPFALMASVEVAPQAGLPIYEEVRQALRVPVAVRAARP
jgi:hypothetical protein